MDYVELHCHTNFSFLDGASFPHELVERAAEVSMPALAITDNQGLYGAVKFRNACWALGVRPIYGAEIDVADAGHVTLLVESETGWHNLCRLLTLSGFQGTKHERPVPWKLLREHAEGLICLTGCRDGVVAAPARKGDKERTLAQAKRLIEIFGRDNCYVELQRHFDRGDRRLNATLIGLARHLDLPVVATNNVHYATPDRFRLQHILTCIRHLTPIDSASALLYPTPHRYLKSAAEMRELFADIPEAIANTGRIAERCEYRLDHSKARIPDFPVPAGETPFSYLADLCYTGLRKRYDPVTPEAMTQLSRELALIEKNDLAGYFLVVHDICRFARDKGIIGQGRGSAAGSIVAYTLGITAVDPIAYELLFDRFLSDNSHSTPDIDVDFAADRREEVIQYVYERYGAEHTAMVANVVTFKARSAIADVGKVLGFPADLLTKVRQALYARSANDIAPDLAEVTDFSKKMTHLPWQMLLEFCAQIADFPRHLSIHNGGMIVTGEPLAGLVPLERATMPGRVVVQWDKDDVEDVGLIKIDILSLGTLGLVGECFEHIERHTGAPLTLDTVPEDVPAVWEMLQAADAIGCFQVESRAQMSLLPRLRPSCMDDLVVEVSLIRPGPIEGGMAHTYLIRRDGDEEVSYWHPCLEPVLKETLGVLVYQEQVLKVSMVAAGFTGAQADGLRRSMSRKRGLEELEKWRSTFVEGAAANGIADEAAHHIFDHLRGFASYGFCKSHAASFARIAYITAWLKCHYPLEFFCSILNAQPMGFYSVEVLLEDAKRHGIRLHPLDINRSSDKWRIEDLRVGAAAKDGATTTTIAASSDAATANTAAHSEASTAATTPTAGALRVPFTRLKGLGQPLADAIVAERDAHGPYTSVWDFVRRVRPSRRIAERLIITGSFDGMPATSGTENVARRSAVSTKNNPRKAMSSRGRDRSHTCSQDLDPATRHDRSHTCSQDLDPATRHDRSHTRSQDLDPATRHDRSHTCSQDLDPATRHDRSHTCSQDLDPATRHDRSHDRRDLLWALGEMRWDAGPLDLPPLVLEAPVPRTSQIEKVGSDYSLLGLAQSEHLMALYRPQLTELGAVSSAEFETMAHGMPAKVAGRVEIVQRPGQAKGIAFVSLEDEHGLVNLLCYPKVYEAFRHVLRSSPVILGEGKVQRLKGTLHLIVERLVPIDVRSGAPGIEPEDIPRPAKEYQ